MSSMRNTMEKLTNWLNAGTSAEVFIKKVLLIATAILAVYRLGYAIGTCC